MLVLPKQKQWRYGSQNQATMWRLILIYGLESKKSVDSSTLSHHQLFIASFLQLQTRSHEDQTSHEEQKEEEIMKEEGNWGKEGWEVSVADADNSLHEFPCTINLKGSSGLTKRKKKIIARGGERERDLVDKGHRFIVNSGSPVRRGLFWFVRNSQNRYCRENLSVCVLFGDITQQRVNTVQSCEEISTA